MTTNSLQIDPRSSFCSSNSTFYNKQKPIPLSPNTFLDITTSISSDSPPPPPPRPHPPGSTTFIEACSGLDVPFPKL
ncbi:hypothetical protein NL676_018247 [Syzygium grande]|nr:hypothetical protein NL676_018247 [Syzygium grande]